MGYYLILDQYLNAPAESKRAAAGWGGDRYEIYEGQSAGDVFIAQLTSWDTENDAREFFDAYAKRTLRRYAEATPGENISGSPANGSITESAKNELRSWHTSEGDVVMELRGNRVLILEGIPNNVNARPLLKASWQ